MNQNNEDKIIYIQEHYGSLMYQKANSILHDSYEAEDAVQEAMIRLMGIADKIEDVSAVKTRVLAVTIAKNIAIDLWRKKSRSLPTEGELLELEPEQETTEQLIDDKESFSGFLKVFLKMPDSYQDILRLRCVHDLSAEETAQLLGTNANAVNIRLTRARKILKARYSVIASLFALFGVGIIGLRTWNLLQPEEPSMLARSSAPAAAYAETETEAAAAYSGTSEPAADSAANIEAASAALQATSLTVLSDHLQNGLRIRTLQDTDLIQLTLLSGSDYDAVTSAFSTDLFDASLTSIWKSSVGNTWITVQYYTQTDGNLSVAAWTFQDQYYALSCTAPITPDILADYAAACTEFDLP